jgi:tight adherence protein B
VSAEQNLSSVATTVHRVAVLLAAGVAPNSAWTYLDAEANPMVARVAAAVKLGTSVPSAIMAEFPARVPADITAATSARASAATSKETPATPPEANAWHTVAAAWRVATVAGTPLAPSLRSVAIALRAWADAQREVQIALAGPVTTARMVMGLPAVAVIFGILLGFDPVRTLFTTATGLAFLTIGLLLIGVAVLWNRRLVARAQPDDTNPGLLCELTAIGISGGSSASRARESVDGALAECLITVTPEDRAVVERIIELSARAGVPSAELLRAEAEELRRLARAHSAKKAAVLSVRLMLPLGLCILPAFVVLGVAPLALSLMTSTVQGF